MIAKKNKIIKNIKIIILFLSVILILGQCVRDRYFAGNCDYVSICEEYSGWGWTYSTAESDCFGGGGFYSTGFCSSAREGICYFDWGTSIEVQRFYYWPYYTYSTGQANCYSFINGDYYAF